MRGAAGRGRGAARRRRVGKRPSRRSATTVNRFAGIGGSSIVAFHESATHRANASNTFPFGDIGTAAMGIAEGRTGARRTTGAASRRARGQPIIRRPGSTVPWCRPPSRRAGTRHGARSRSGRRTAPPARATWYVSGFDSPFRDHESSADAARAIGSHEEGDRLCPGGLVGVLRHGCRAPERTRARPELRQQHLRLGCGDHGLHAGTGRGISAGRTLFRLFSQPPAPRRVADRGRRGDVAGGVFR